MPTVRTKVERQVANRLLMRQSQPQNIDEQSTVENAIMTFTEKPKFLCSSIAKTFKNGIYTNTSGVKLPCRP